MIENQNIEFKLKWNDNCLKSCCAFANTDGGKLLIGFDDNGLINGISNVKEQIENLPNIIRNVLDIYVSILSKKEDGKDYIEINIPKVNHPVFFNGRIYIRVGSTNQLLEGNSLLDFIIRKGAGSWDSVCVDNVNVSDLDEESFDILKKEGIKNQRLIQSDMELSREEVLTKLSLMKDGKLTRAAILLFHPHPEYYVPGAYVILGKFDSKGNLRYTDEIYGSLFKQAHNIEDLLVLKYMYATISYDNFTRVETLPFPRIAIREGIFNALMHNNYLSQQPIQIRVSPNELWISNKCIFPIGWTEETLLKAHESHQMNPNISAGFFRAGFVERFGSGISKILDSCNVHGNPSPKFIINGDMFSFRMESLLENKQLIIESGTEKLESGTEKLGSGTEKLGSGTEKLESGIEKLESGIELDKGRKFITDVDEYSVYDFILSNPTCTYSQIAESMNLSRRSIARIIENLRSKQLIKYEGSTKKGKWIILK